MQEFLTTHKTQPPTIPIWVYLLILVGLVFSLVIAYRYHSKKWFLQLFKAVQLLQLLGLYGWYLVFTIPVSDSLPLYHCRLAMLGLVFLPDSWKLKRYLAYLGFAGAIFALGYPVLDPYDFPHITGVSFIIGHFALLINSFAYLLNYRSKESLSIPGLVARTFLLDLILLGVNHITGGNYGIMRFTPIINSTNVWINYLAVSSVYSLALVICLWGFKFYKKA